MREHRKAEQLARAGVRDVVQHPGDHPPPDDQHDDDEGGDLGDGDRQRRGDLPPPRSPEVQRRRCRLPLRIGTSAGSSTSVSTMARSSTISQPTAMRPRSVSRMRRSCSARSSTTVLATDSARPKMMPAPIGQPSE